jgi:hypothetical protein
MGTSLVAPYDNPYGPLVKFRTLGIFPPSAVYVGPSDALEFEARSPSVSTAVNVTVRILTPQGEIKEIPLAFTVATSGTAVFTSRVPPTEGFVLTAHASANNASRGQCFVKLHLLKNPGASAALLGALLFQGYLSADDHLSYPQSPTESSLTPPGWTHTIIITAPGAGNDWSTQAPAGVRWRLKTVFAAFTASATVASRGPRVILTDSAARLIADLPISPAITASQVCDFTWGEGLTPQSIVLANLVIDTAQLPGQLLLPQQAFVKSLTNSLQAGDAWTAILLTVEEFVAQ